MNRTIKKIIDARTGEVIDVDVLLDGCAERTLHEIRERLYQSHKRQKDEYLCALCRKALHLSGNPKQEHFFKHSLGKDEGCPWHTGRTSTLEELDRLKFGGQTESAQHKFLKTFIGDFLKKEASEVHVDDSWIVQETGRRKPDVSCLLRGRPTAFELQLSTTYLPVIAEREQFYKENGYDLIWVFHTFSNEHQPFTQKDIYFRNRGNAFVLDEEAISLTRQQDQLKLRVYCLWPKLCDGKIGYEWRKKFVGLTDLFVSPATSRPIYKDCLSAEAELRAKLHKDSLESFDGYWRSNHDNKQLELWEIFNSLTNKLFDASWHITGEKAHDLRFFDALKRLFALSLGEVDYGKESMISGINTALEHWRGYTTHVVAFCKAYNRTDLLEIKSVQEKIKRNLLEENPIYEFDEFLRVLFPKVRPYL